MTESNLPDGYLLAREDGELDPGEYVQLVARSGLRRPTDDLPRMTEMLRNSNLVLTIRGRSGGLVGAARSITDFAWSCYLADLCVDPTCQGLGLGKALLRETKRLVGPRSTVLLLSVPDAMTWYPRTGMAVVDNGFILHREPIDPQTGTSSPGTEDGAPAR